MSAAIADVTVDAGIVDCWNRIGVHGDSSCIELARHIHCRNCPVYSAAAIKVLDRERPDQNLSDVTRLFAAAKLDRRRAGEAAFLFRVGAEWLALPSASIDEVADLRAIHSLPHRRSGVVLGLANVRGELLVCVSLHHLLGIDTVAEAASARNQRVVHRRLVVMRGQGNRLAFPADEVHGMERFDEQDLKPVPATVAKASASYSKSILTWRVHAVGLLDDELLLHSLNRALA